MTANASNTVTSLLTNLETMRLPDNPSLTVMLGYLSHTLDKEKAFNLLPRLLDDVDSSLVRRGGKVNLPVYPMGTFINLSYMGHSRGILSKCMTSYMKHVIEITVSGRERNVGVKLTPEKIHLTGKVEEIEGGDIIRAVFSQMLRINNMLLWVYNNQEICSKLIEGILDITCPEGVLEIIDPTEEQLSALFSPTDDENTRFLLTYFMDLAGDFLYQTDYKKKLEYALMSGGFIDANVTLKSVDSKMLNYNYNIGFTVNKIGLVKLMEKSNNFLARYDNSIKEDVTIEYPHEEQSTTKLPRRKDTLIFRGRGAIMHSGRTRSEMENVFTKFINIISEDVNRGEMSLILSA